MSENLSCFFPPPTWGKWKQGRKGSENRFEVAKNKGCFLEGVFVIGWFSIKILRGFLRGSPFCCVFKGFRAVNGAQRGGETYPHRVMH